MGNMRNSIMRRGAAALLAWTVACSCADISAQAGVVPKAAGTVIAQGDLEKGAYIVQETGRWQLDSEGTLTVSGNILENEDLLEDYKDQIQRVQIQNGVTKVPQEAFADCKNLKSVSIPDSVTAIGTGAFSGCTGLTSISIPDSVVTWGMKVFSGCANLKKAELTSMCTEMFKDCINLTDVTLRQGCSAVAYGAFRGCASLETITIPEGVKKIDEYSFYGCSSLKSIYIPSSVEILGKNHDQSLGSSPFIGCTALSDLTVSPQNASCCYENGILYNKDKTEMIFCANAQMSGSFTVPAQVTKIYIGALGACTGLKSIRIPASVLELKNTSYGRTLDCPGLERIEVDADHAGYASQDGILYNKDKTVLLEYPQNRAGDSFTVPGGVQTIEGLSFSSCKNLKNIVFPQSVDEINAQAFSYTKLSSIAVYNADCWIDNAAYGYVFPEDGDMANGYTDDIIYGHPGSGAEELAKMSGKTFKPLSELTQNPGQNPGQQNPGQQNPGQQNPGQTNPGQTNPGQTNPGQQTKKPLAKGKTFTDSKTKGKFKVTNASASKPAVAFTGVTKKAKKVVIPASVSYQGVKYQVTSIAAKALKGNTKVTSVEIGSSVTKIDKNAFDGCKNLKSIKVKTKSLKSVGKNALKGIHKKCKIKVPSSKLKDYKKKFKGKGQAKSVKITK